MKIAIFHNYLDNIGGAEMVALTLAKELKADLFTTNIDFEKIKKMGFSNLNIRSIGVIPINAPFRHQIALWKFRKLNLKGKYDFYIIAGDWAMSGAVNNKPNLWYIHSPLNEIWELKNYVRNEVIESWKKPFFDLWVSLNRKLTLDYSNHIQKWISNSENTKKRIKKYYNKEAVVMNPPINTSSYFFNKNKNYWLSVNRLSKHKRIELQLKVFSKMPKENLIIVGSYEKGANQFEKYKKYIESIKPNNVKIINWAENKKLINLYSQCKGLIATAKDEDFGMTLVEAMASGKPVIAVKEGGYKETVIDGKTGLLIREPYEKKLFSAIKKVNSNLKENPNMYKETCQKRASLFDTKFFIKKMKDEIKR